MTSACGREIKIKAHSKVLVYEGESGETEERAVAGRGGQNTLNQKNLLSRTLRGALSGCSQDLVSHGKSEVFYLRSIEIIYAPVTLPIEPGDVRVGMAICEIVLTGVCVGDSFSLQSVEYFYLYKLGNSNILL